MICGQTFAHVRKKERPSDMRTSLSRNFSIINYCAIINQSVLPVNSELIFHNILGGDSMTDNRTSRLIARFGTYQQCAAAVGVTYQAVLYWCQHDRVSSKMIPRVIRAGRRRKPPVMLTPNDFFAEDLR
jgi:hypothetical protein